MASNTGVTSTSAISTSNTMSMTMTTSSLMTTTQDPHNVGDTCYGELDAVAAEEGAEIGDKIETLSLQDCQRSCTGTEECQSFAFCPHFEGCWMKTKMLMGNEPTRDFYDCRTYYKRPCETTAHPPLSSSTTPTTTSTSQAFVPIGGEGQACRGSSSTDTSDSYYTLMTGLMLDECKAKCIAEPLCKGIEHNPNGRCEVWTRPEGIHATAPVAGYTCLVYGTLPATTSPPMLTEFRPVDGGEGRACRGSSASDNSADYYDLLTSVFSLSDCANRCLAHTACKGIEHHSNGRCEIWTRPDGIEASAPVAGYTCLAYALPN